MRKAKENRAVARAALKGNLGSAILVAILSSLVVGAVSAIPFAGQIAMIVIAPPIMYGAQLFFMNMIRRNNPQVGDIFTPFKVSFSQAIITNLIMGIFLFFWTLLFIVPGIIKSYSYAMTSYLVNNDPNLSGTEAITRSRELMNGNKFRLFCLRFSFIGWILLSMLTFGILLLVYVDPYMQTAEAAFFQEIAENAGITPKVEQEAA